MLTGQRKPVLLIKLNSLDSDDVAVEAGASQIEATKEDAFDVERDMEDEEVHLGVPRPLV